MAVDRQPPDVVAMILADSVLQDLVTWKLVINGAFSSITTDDFPVAYPFVVYTAITGGRGRTKNWSCEWSTLMKNAIL